MLKEHPRGLFVAFFANMGERFGYYTMLAIFTLFLQAKYGYTAGEATQIFGIFLAFVYFLPLLGGILADRYLGYGKTISLGLVVMLVGYFMLAMPTTMDGGKALIFAALGVISLGTGFFKGNLQALVGNLYDDPKYNKYRDIAFNIFYMGINIGAMFAPSAADAVSNWILKKKGYFYNADIPALAHKFLEGNGNEVVEKAGTVSEKLAQLAQSVGYSGDAESFSHWILEKQELFQNTDLPGLASSFLAGNGAEIVEKGITVGEKLAIFAQQQGFTGDLANFSTNYINVLSESYHYAFGVACISLIVSMIIFWAFRKYYKHADMTEIQKAASEEHKDKVVEMSPEQTRERLIALGLIFFVVIFFWMAFHQNGAAMTIFARDYTVGSVDKFTNLWFDLFGLLPIFLSLVGMYFLIRKKSTGTIRMLGAVAFIGFALLAYFRFQTYEETNPFTPQKFQHFNPFFIVALTPIVVGIFGYLNRIGKEPSAPRKIGIGMIITGAAFIILVIGSLQLIGYSPGEINEVRAPRDVLLSPNWLISTYFILTIAELFLSPMGISFVSKVSPPKYKGMMQGGWLAATAIGNYAVGIVCLFWDDVPLWAFWGILVVFALLSATFIFSILKRLERATST